MITQRLILDGPYPDGVWTCIGCASPLTEGRIQHPDDCPELRGLGRASRRMGDSEALRHFPSPDRPGVSACGFGRPPARIQVPIVTDPSEVTCGRCKLTSAWRAANRGDIAAAAERECPS